MAIGLALMLNIVLPENFDSPYQARSIIDFWRRWHMTLSNLLVTSAAVLAEVFHLVGDRPREVDTAWGFLRSGAVSVLPIDHADLPALETLMRRYADHPMDFADATLVHLAHRESLATVCTIDHGDFKTYRIGGQRRFRVVPDR